MKTQYIRPGVETLQLADERLLAALSKGSGPSPGEGEAKKNTFIDEPSWVGASAWENLSPEDDETEEEEQ